MLRAVAPDAIIHFAPKENNQDWATSYSATGEQDSVQASRPKVSKATQTLSYSPSSQIQRASQSCQQDEESQTTQSPTASQACEQTCEEGLSLSQSAADFSTAGALKDTVLQLNNTLQTFLEALLSAGPPNQPTANVAQGAADFPAAGTLKHTVLLLNHTLQTSAEALIFAGSIFLPTVRMLQPFRPVEQKGRLPLLAAGRLKLRENARASQRSVTDKNFLQSLRLKISPFFLATVRMLQPFRPVEQVVRYPLLAARRPKLQGITIRPSQGRTPDYNFLERLLVTTIPNWRPVLMSQPLRPVEHVVLQPLLALRRLKRRGEVGRLLEFIKGSGRRRLLLDNGEYIRIKPEAMMPVPGSTAPLTAASLASAPPAVQKQMIGEMLYPRIAKLQPELAREITDMMLGINNSDLLILLESDAQLKGKIDE
ncbi:unnamed protein product, partial [Polarella glacialis]